MRAMPAMAMLLPPATTTLVITVLVGLLLLSLFGGRRRPRFGFGRWLQVGLVAIVLATFLFANFRHEIEIMLARAELPTPGRLKREWQLLSFPDQRATPLSSFEGKVVIINLWATWCPPCVSEMPSFQKLYDKYKDHPEVAFVMVSFDQVEDDLRRYLKQTEYTFPIYRPMEEPPRRLKPLGFPTTYIIGKDFVLRYEYSGPHDWFAPEKIEVIEKLLAETVPPRTGA